MECRAKDSCGLLLKVRPDMAVCIGRDCKGAMTEPLLNDFHWRAQSKQNARVGMAQVMRADAWQVRGDQSALKRASDLIGREVCADLVGKDQVAHPPYLRLSAHLSLAQLMRAENVDQVGVDGHGAPAAVRLDGAEDVALPSEPLQLLLKRDGVGLEIQVAPAEA